MNDKKLTKLQRKEVENILLKNIYKLFHSKNITIGLKDDNIYSSQLYYSLLDSDMSDFAIGFYKIIYKDILNNVDILKNNGRLLDKNKSFAGDTMNSLKKITRTLFCNELEQNKWPKYLLEYYNQYHCLANFWILPMEIGRTLSGNLNKGRKGIYDYMDRFLEQKIRKLDFSNLNTENYYDYFSKFKDFKDFCDKHFLTNCYTNEKYEINSYSFQDPEEIINVMIHNIKKRAKLISNSKYAYELYNYFKLYGLIK